MTKTGNIIRGLIQTILTCGGVISIVCFTILLANTKWLFDNHIISLAIRSVEIFTGVEMAAFYFRYVNSVNKAAKRKKEQNIALYRKEHVLKKINNSHLKAKVDSLFAGTLMCVILYVAVRIVSYAMIRYSYCLDTFFANTILLSALHIGLLAVPYFLWKTDEVNRYFSDVFEPDTKLGEKYRKKAASC